MAAVAGGSGSLSGVQASSSSRSAISLRSMTANTTVIQNARLTPTMKAVPRPLATTSPISLPAR